MVLPLLPVMAGLLATGAAGAAGSRWFTDMMDERKGDRAREKQGSVWDGILGNAQAAGMDPAAMGMPGQGGAPRIPGQSFGEGARGPAGLLSQDGAQGPGSTMPDMLQLARGLGSAGYMGEALGILDAERGYDVGQENATTAFNRTLQRDEIQQQYQQSNIRQQQGPAWARLAFDQAQAAAQQNQLPVYEGVGVQPEQYMSFASQDAAVDTLEQVKAYARGTNAADRYGPGSSETRSRLQSEYQMTVLPALQQLFKAGAMQKEEMQLFQQIGGDPLAWDNINEAQLGKVQAVINKLEKQREIERNAYGVPYVPRTLSGSSGGAPAGTEPYTPGG